MTNGIEHRAPLKSEEVVIIDRSRRKLFSRAGSDDDDSKRNRDSREKRHYRVELVQSRSWKMLPNFRTKNRREIRFDGSKKHSDLYSSLIRTCTQGEQFSVSDTSKGCREIMNGRSSSPHRIPSSGYPSSWCSAFDLALRKTSLVREGLSSLLRKRVLQIKKKSNSILPQLRSHRQPHFKNQFRV